MGITETKTEENAQTQAPSLTLVQRIENLPTAEAKKTTPPRGPRRMVDNCVICESMIIEGENLSPITCYKPECLIELSKEYLEQTGEEITIAQLEDIMEIIGLETDENSSLQEMYEQIKTAISDIKSAVGKKEKLAGNANKGENANSS